MKSDVYNLVTINDGKSDGAAIVKILSEMAAGRLKSDLRLLNYYDEVPVSYPATIVSVDVDSVELTIHENQAVLLKLHNSTLLKSKHFHHEMGVHCYAAYINVPKKTVILHNFAYAQIRAERREAVRVKVYENLPVTFSYNNTTIEGNMVDISGSGISTRSELAPEIIADQSGLLSFRLMGSTLKVPGTLVKSGASADGGHICIFQMKLDRNSDTIVGQFIYQRQVEIIQQLKEGLVVQL
jgi:hypothetical protein